MTEWQLQRELTSVWQCKGAMLGGETLFLAAWEVMVDWRINDAHLHWNRPSIDFLFLDQAGGLVAVELKRAVRTPGDAWRALCQVTHRAVELARSYEFTLLCEAHRACTSGEHGRVAPPSGVSELSEGFRAFFEVPVPLALPGRPLRRVVAARHFGPSWPTILEQFNGSTFDEIERELGRRYDIASRSNRELARFLELGGNADGCVPGVVEMVVE